MTEYMEVWLIYAASCTAFCAACLYFVLKIRPLFIRYLLAALLCLLNAMPVKVGVSYAPLLAVLAVDVISGKLQVMLMLVPLAIVFAVSILLALLLALRSKKLQAS